MPDLKMQLLNCLPSPVSANRNYYDYLKVKSNIPIGFIIFWNISLFVVTSSLHSDMFDETGLHWQVPDNWNHVWGPNELLNKAEQAG